MIHISTFSGIGGFELAAQWMGWKNYASCEINPFGSKVLEYYWPEAYHHKDIKTLTYEILNNELIQRFGKGWRNEPVVLTGGFPCQDASIAKQYGERQQGLQGERTGLFYEFSRLISELRPSWIISENVSNLLKINGGGDFSKVLTELSSMGYNAEWRVCTASEVGAPHHRERMYLVAYPESIRLQKEQTFFRYVEEKAQQVEWLFDGTSIQTFRGGYWLGEPPAICVANGVSNKLPGYTDSQWRIEMYKAFGNAVVPQIPFKIFKAIREHQKLITNS